MKINNKIGYLGILLTLATLTNSVAEAKETQTIGSSSTIAERLANIQNKLKEKQQQISQSSPEGIETELLAIFGDFGDSFPFSDFADVPIFGPGFGDFGDSFPFGDFGDLW